MEGDLIDALRNHADRYGVVLSGLHPLEHGENMTLTEVRRGRQAQEYLALLSPHMSMPATYPNETWTGHPLLVLGAKVTPRNADRLRELGVNYLDANGNAYLRFGDVLIDVRGRSGDPVAALHQDKSVTSNLFSPKRAQVIFALISWPDSVNAKLREIASIARVSVGFAQKTLVDLEAANYLQTLGAGRQGRQLNNVDALIDGWVASFPGGLGSPDNTRAFRGTFDPDVLSNDGPEIYLSGEAAADWLPRNATWSLYCDEIPSRAAAAGRWTARSSSPNIFVRPIFWTTPAVHTTGRIQVAPPLLVYADLVSSGESRQREAAERYRSEHVGLHADRPATI
ncbi:type IV toxin-antitoxin system AbiEi family antitoxin [Microbacterium sp. NPDC056234]|uniref:type IV toxin-antitoxin system AbiEi family antitoxin n=1 Tax=Microbacterium sp. NPDC056234 TaxID=3345757 RepID=UPI0035D90B13